MWARLRESGVLSRMVFDINMDGVSIFTTPPAFNNDGAQSELYRIFQTTGVDFVDSAVVTLDIDKKGGRDVTIILYLEEVAAPDPDEGVA